MSEQTLSGMKVVDLTWYIAGPYCTKLFADFGAEVLKIERPPDGDPARMIGPFLGDDPHHEKSLLFSHLNLNKKSAMLDLKSEEGIGAIKALVKEADILVENFSPGVMARLGLDYENLRRVNPNLVMTSISNFGQTGPYRDFKASELVLAGLGYDMYSGIAWSSSSRSWVSSLNFPTMCWILITKASWMPYGTSGARSAPRRKSWRPVRR